MKVVWDCHLLRGGTVEDESNFMQIEAQTISHEVGIGTEWLDLFDNHNVLEGEQSMDDEAPQELDQPLDKSASNRQVI